MLEMNAKDGEIWKKTALRACPFAALKGFKLLPLCKKAGECL